MIGGAGIVAGLALYGYKIMRVIGVKAASSKSQLSRNFGEVKQRYLSIAICIQ